MKYVVVIVPFAADVAYVFIIAIARATRRTIGRARVWTKFNTIFMFYSEQLDFISYRIACLIKKHSHVRLNLLCMHRWLPSMNVDVQCEHET